MSASLSSARAGRHEGLAALAYGLCVVALLALAGLLAADLAARAGRVEALRERLAAFEARAGAKLAEGGGGGREGSPFVEGQTVTVAGAALQQRIESAIARAGGVVRSSQVDIEGPQAKDGFVAVTANLEIPEPGLQGLLYDLEAGMPYLFVDALGAQIPQGPAEAGGPRLVVTLAVSGQWRAPL